MKKTNFLSLIIIVFAICAGCSNVPYEFMLEPCQPVVGSGVGSVEPVEDRNLRWKWAESTLPNYNQTMATPMVSDIDGDGTSDFIFTSFPSKSSKFDGVLRVVSGKNGRELWSYSGMLDAKPYGITVPAIYDLNKDGKPEILVAGTSSLIILNNNGTIFKSFTLTETTPPTSRITVANEKNGVFDILIGMAGYSYIYRYNIKAQTLTMPILDGVLAIMDVDINFPGAEYITNNAIYSAAWTQLADIPVKIRNLVPTNPNAHSVGFGKFANGTDIVMVANNPLTVTTYESLTGKLLSSWTEPELDIATCNARQNKLASMAGAPNVGDMDGDGWVDVSFAGACNFWALKNTTEGLSLLWKKETRDFSSGSTGSSLFDFNGDNRVEVLYNDELFFHLIDGRTGKVLYKLPNDNGTLWEHPVVVSLNHDEPAVIVISANSYSLYTESTIPLILEDPIDNIANVTGLRVIRGGNNNWLPTRTIWNQYDYVITNVSDNLQIPINPLNFLNISNRTRANVPQITIPCI